MTLLLSAIGRTSAPYSHVVLLSSPSVPMHQHFPLPKGQKTLTVADDEQVDAEDRKSLADLVVRVFKEAQHDGGVDFDDDDARHSRQNHSCLQSENDDAKFGVQTYGRRPHWSVRYLVVMQLEMKATVP